MLARARPACCSSAAHSSAATFALQLLKPDGVLRDEAAIDPAVLDQDLAARRRGTRCRRPALTGKPIVGDLRAEERAVRRSTAPSTSSCPARDSGFTSTTFVPSFLRLVEILRRDRLIVGRVRAEEDDQVGAVPILVAARAWRRRRSMPSSRAGGRMAEARGVVDVVRAEEARHFLRHVIDLVRDAARGEKNAIRRGSAPRMRRAMRS